MKRAQESEFALVRRQGRAAVRKLVSPAAYLGAAREFALTAVHVVAYPLGILPGIHADEPRWTPQSIADRSLLTTDPETACTPVILLHGWVHNRSAFLLMSRALKRAGFQHVHGFNYNPIADSVPAIAAKLGAEVERVLAATGAERCQIVGHSMGGLVARYYVQQVGGEDTVDTVITLATPHRGTYSAYLGVGAAARELRPGSWLMRELAATARPSDVRYIAYYSDLDPLVTPAVSAKLSHPALQATNVRVGDVGHLSLLLSGEVLRGVVHRLAHRDEDRPEPSTVSSLPTSAQLQRRSSTTAATPTLERSTADAGSEGQ